MKKSSGNVGGSHADVHQKVMDIANMGLLDAGASTSRPSKTKNTANKHATTNTSASSRTNLPQKKDDKEIGKPEGKRKTRRRERKMKLQLKKEPVELISVNPLPENISMSKTLIMSNSSMPKKSAVSKSIPRLSPTVDSTISFRIRRIKKPLGCLYRKRNTSYRYVNLKSFVGRGSTFVFQSDIHKLKQSSEKVHSKSSSAKNQRRKYNVAQIQKKTEILPGTSQNYTEIEDVVENIQQLSVTNESNQSDNVTSDCSITVFDSSFSGLDTTQSELDTSKTPKRKRPRFNKKKEKHVQRKLQKQLEKENSEIFPPYFALDDVKQGLENGELIQGFLRVNPKNSKDSYISNEDTSHSDYHITSVVDRNRGLDGDEVAIKLKPQEEWKDGKPTAFVVYILKQINPRTMVGTLSLGEEKDSKFAIFRPRDKRMPLMMIPKLSWPNGFRADPKLYQKTLFLGKMLEWDKPGMASGVILEALGLKGDLRVETQSILKEFELDATPFSPDMVQYLPKSMDIPKEELQSREDIRKECVFTIDPFTARDLDDAVSVKNLSNGRYEIGVHISDASYYLKEGTELDKKVCKKATTIYLVDNVYHMLPVELCLHCSLLPGEDKLAFSVFWEMNEQGEIFNTRFARTVVNSCVQLAYEHAQVMIENPSKEYSQDELPHIYNDFTAQDLSRTVNVLQKIAVNLRNTRIKNGSLRIDQVKLLFSLDSKTGEPNDFKVYENKEAHRLIEEFMLLANISVAKQINESFPDLAFLRCHEPPKYTMLREAQQVLESCGILIDISSSGGIHSSLRKYITNDFQGQVRSVVLNHIFAKPMTRARYFCAATMPSELNYAHYALSVPIYTHFTSPIRRYADIMVHRLLAASLGYSGRPVWSLQMVQEIAANCNKQKFNAKRAGEASSDLYLAHYIEKHKPYIQDCVVVDVRERSFDAIVLKTGSMVRIYQKTCEDKPNWTLQAIPIGQSTPVSARDIEITRKIYRLTVTYPKTKKNPREQVQIIEMFSVVKVQLRQHEHTYKLDGYLVRPVPTLLFQSRSIS